ncbi:type II secretion system GspH family protein [Candidatus Saccharibacteria bacterium]|nr:type II secretion system GspH family protein [Candidatus Saccharibacteria bacterium]
MKRNQAEQGDTLVEVTVAMAVLGLMLAASLAVINRGLMGVSNAVERTSVRASLSSQAELLRYVFDDPVTNKVTYGEILKRTKPNNNLGQNGCKIGGGGFYLSVNNKTGTPPVEIHELDSADTDHLANNVYGQPEAGDDKRVSRGIWIEGDKHDGQNGMPGMPGYIDFYVRACWTPHAAQQPGSGRMESNVRVYYKK